MHKHKYTIKAFKNKLADGEQDQIHLIGGDSGTGYRIVKLRAIPEDIGTTSTEGVFQVWKGKQTTVPTVATQIDFSNNELLAVAICRTSTDLGATGTDDHVIFSNEVFNQDIYVTYTDNQAANNGNYYLELEEVKMTGPQEAVVNYSAVILNTS